MGTQKVYEGRINKQDLLDRTILTDGKEMNTERITRFTNMPVGWGKPSSTLTTALAILSDLYPNEKPLDHLPEIKALSLFLEQMPLIKPWQLTDRAIMRQIRRRVYRSFKGVPGRNPMLNEVIVGGQTLSFHYESKGFSNRGFEWGEQSPETDQLAWAIVSEILGGKAPYESRLHEFAETRGLLKELTQGKPWKLTEQDIRSRWHRTPKVYKGLMQRNNERSASGPVMVNGYLLYNYPGHSPCTQNIFGWGFKGNGPSHLAVSILIDLFEETEDHLNSPWNAFLIHEWVEKLPPQSWSMTSEDFFSLLKRRDLERDYGCVTTG